MLLQGTPTSFVGIIFIASALSSGRIADAPMVENLANMEKAMGSLGKTKKEVIILCPIESFTKP